MKAFKLARQILTIIQKLRIPTKYQVHFCLIRNTQMKYISFSFYLFKDYVDLASLSIRAKPFHDNEDLLSMCYRCLTYNSPVVQTCVTCHHKFILSFIKFGLYYL